MGKALDQQWVRGCWLTSIKQCGNIWLRYVPLGNNELPWSTHKTDIAKIQNLSDSTKITLPNAGSIPIPCSSSAYAHRLTNGCKDAKMLKWKRSVIHQLQIYYWRFKQPWYTQKSNSNFASSGNV